MSNIKREAKKNMAVCPWSGRQTDLGQEQTNHNLSNSGGIESATLAQQAVSSCGCILPPVAFCAECISLALEGTVCEQCKGFCERCHKPICPRHSIFDHPIEHRATRLCSECHGELKRGNISKSLFRALFSPFIDFGESQ